MPARCGLYYFEVRVVNAGVNGYIGAAEYEVQEGWHLASPPAHCFGISLCKQHAGRSAGVGLAAAGFGPAEQDVLSTRLPGWEDNSYGYHGDDGHSFHASGQGRVYGPTYSTGTGLPSCASVLASKPLSSSECCEALTAGHGDVATSSRHGANRFWRAGDTIGVLLSRTTGTISYFKNGVELGVADSHVQEQALYPCVGLRSRDGEVCTSSEPPTSACNNITCALADGRMQSHCTCYSMHSAPCEHCKWLIEDV